MGSSLQRYEYFFYNAIAERMHSTITWNSENN